VHAEAHRIPVEQVKTGLERGTYLHPELFEAPVERSLVAAGTRSSPEWQREKKVVRLL
jgi:hypothetical protein